MLFSLIFKFNEPFHWEAMKSLYVVWVQFLFRPKSLKLRKSINLDLNDEIALIYQNLLSRVEGV